MLWNRVDALEDNADRRKDEAKRSEFAMKNSINGKIRMKVAEQCSRRRLKRPMT
jgi:hypothetical protein